jgi:hypothetical protein
MIVGSLEMWHQKDSKGDMIPSELRRLPEWAGPSDCDKIVKQIWASFRT